MELGEAYEVLGLLPGADETLVRAAYRARAKRDHPDYGGTQQAFIRSEQAFRCIERAGFPSAGGHATEAGRGSTEGESRGTQPGPGPQRDWPGWHWSEQLDRWVCDAHHGSRCEECHPGSQPLRTAPTARRSAPTEASPPPGPVVSVKSASRARYLTYAGGFLVLVAGMILVGISQNDVTVESGTWCGNSFDVVFKNYSDPACDEYRSNELVGQGIVWTMLVVGAALFAIGVRRWWRAARDAPSDRPFGVRVRERIFYAAAIALSVYLYNTYCRPPIDSDQPTQTAAPAESPVDAVQRVMCSQVARWCTVTPEYLASNIAGSCLTLAQADPYWALSNGEIVRVLSDTSAQAIALGMSTEEQAFEIDTLNGAVLALRAELC